MSPPSKMPSHPLSPNPSRFSFYLCPQNPLVFPSISHPIPMFTIKKAVCGSCSLQFSLFKKKWLKRLWLWLWLRLAVLVVVLVVAVLCGEEVKRLKRLQLRFLRFAVLL